MADIPITSLAQNSLPLWDPATVHRRLDEQLCVPANDLFNRPKKAFRARLVELGYQMAGGTIDDSSRKSLAVAAEAIEQLHAGTLIIDDIQDGSSERRSSQTIHERYGVARAICVGNWLYFSPLRLLSRINLHWTQERLIHSAYVEALEKGHYGQSLDVSTDLTELHPEELKSICFACMDLKTGSLTALALKIGAIIATDQQNIIEPIGEFGRQLGFALQCFDDVGNCCKQRAGTKYLEDLQLKKPGFVWAIIHDLYPKETLREFRETLDCLPEQNPINSWMETHNFHQRFFDQANKYLIAAENSGISCLSRNDHFECELSNQIKEICHEVRTAYL